MQPSTFFILPMLGKHPEKYPRFRDCFFGKMFQSKQTDQFGIPIWEHGDEDMISIYMRIGGQNRADYAKEIDALRTRPGYIEDFDDTFDDTFCVFVFDVPKKFVKDFKKIREGRFTETSRKYKDTVESVFPLLAGEFPWSTKHGMRGKD